MLESENLMSKRLSLKVSQSQSLKASESQRLRVSKAQSERVRVSVSESQTGMRVLWDTRGKSWSGASGLDLVATSDTLPGFEIDLSEALSLPKFKFLKY